MYGEIDLELYTISIIRLNSAFQKLDSIDEAKNMLEESLSDLNQLYHDIVEDLNQDEVNLNEYYLFFQNGRQTFPHYIEALSNIEEDSLQEVINSLLNVFNNLNKIADAFSKEGLNEMGFK